MSFLSRAFSGAPEPEYRDITGLNSVPTVYEDAVMGNSQYGVTESTAMTLSAFYACVTLLADTVASLSLKAYRQKDGTKVVVDPQPRLLIDSPYPECTWFSWLWMMMESLCVTGNAFGYITARGDDDRPTAIMPVHPDVVRIEIPRHEGIENPDPIYRIGGEKVPAEDIVHFKRYPIPGAVLGMSPIQKLASQVGLGLAADRYGLRYFQDSANPSGVLSTESELTEQQTKRAMKTWVQSHQGRRLPAVLSNGLKWEAISITPEESQFLETRRFQVTEIARMFRIPPHMIGETEKSTSWGSGLEQQVLGFTKFNLNAWVTSFEQEMTRLLPRGQTAEFSLDDLQRADFETRWKGYQLGRDSGVYSVNDIRQMEGLPPVENGDIRLQPLNYVPLGTPPPPKTEPAAKRYGDEDTEIL